MTTNPARVLSAAFIGLLLLSGCGGRSGSASGSDPTHTMSDGTTMTDAEMRSSEKADEHGHGEAESASAPGSVTRRHDGPSEAAGMICSREIAQAVQRTFGLSGLPQATDRWADQTYTCDYQLSASTLRLSVKDVDGTTAGRDFFDDLAHRLPGAVAIKGLQNLGFPALETPSSVGSVVFLKDHKTLWVDARRVASRDLAPGFSRTGAAYGVAAAVIACWTE
jgi:hypothetical protein